MKLSLIPNFHFLYLILSSRFALVYFVYSDSIQIPSKSSSKLKPYFKFNLLIYLNIYTYVFY